MASMSVFFNIQPPNPYISHRLFGQEKQSIPKSSFSVLDRKLLGNSEIGRKRCNEKCMIYNFIFERYLRNLTENLTEISLKIRFYEFFTHFFLFFQSFRLKIVRSQLISSFSLKFIKFWKKWCNRWIFTKIIELSTTFQIFKIMHFSVWNCWN